MWKRWMALLLALLLPLTALSESVEAPQPVVVDLMNNPDTPYEFKQDTPLLEVWFPAVQGADACVMRFGDETMMIDAATIGQRERVQAVFGLMGLTRIDTCFNTHPHDDHIAGFQTIPEDIELGRMVLTFPEDENISMENTVRIMKERGVPIEHAAQGDVLELGDARLEVIQRGGSSYTINNRSAMLRVTYGERALLMAADVELRTQNNLLENPPACGLQADILKYPHHGIQRAGYNFLKAVGAELSVVTNTRYRAKAAVKDAKMRHMPLVFTADGIVRLRTDGEIWVMDRVDATAAEQLLVTQTDSAEGGA